MSRPETHYDDNRRVTPPFFASYNLLLQVVDPFSPFYSEYHVLCDSSDRIEYLSNHTEILKGDLRNTVLFCDLVCVCCICEFFLTQVY